MWDRRDAYRVWWGSLRERDNLEDLDVDWRIILKRSSINKFGNADWIDLAQDREKWRAFVCTVMNLGVSENAGYFFTS
jgi:hypothetical protein